LDEGRAVGSILGIVPGTRDGVELGSPLGSPLGVEESIGLGPTLGISPCMALGPIFGIPLGTMERHWTRLSPWINTDCSRFVIILIRVFFRFHEWSFVSAEMPIMVRYCT
jgi:hypothetical protein